MPNPGQVFNSGSIAFGGRFENIGTLVAGNPVTISGGLVYYVERFSMNYGTKRLLRPGVIGEPNGFVLTRDQPTGAIKLQVPLGSGVYNASTGGWDGVPWPTLGMGFVDRFLAANEVWVLASFGIPIEMQTYYQVEVDIIQATLAGASGL